MKIINARGAAPVASLEARRESYFYYTTADAIKTGK